MGKYKVECPGCEVMNEEASAQDVLRASYITALLLEHQARRHGTKEERAQARRRTDRALDAFDGLVAHLDVAEVLVREGLKELRKKRS